ncbi:MAG: hypothetical protein ACYSUH_08560 [Planctomycetota bacterium]
MEKVRDPSARRIFFCAPECGVSKRTHFLSVRPPAGFTPVQAISFDRLFHTLNRQQKAVSATPKIQPDRPAEGGQ